MNSIINNIHSVEIDDEGEGQNVAVRIPKEHYKEFAEIAVRRGFRIGALIGKLMVFYMTLLEAQGEGYGEKEKTIP